MTAHKRRSHSWREVEYRVNNTIIPGPHSRWACARHPDLATDDALNALWHDIATATRLDEPDPVQSWHRRFAELTGRARELTAGSFDAIRLEGPGTDLRIGLLPHARWEGPTNLSQRGVQHAWNIPCEEIYTSPNPSRAEGYVRLTRPAVVGGALVEDVSLTFEHGRVTAVTGGVGVERLRAFIDRDAGTCRIGEIAVVDNNSAVGRIPRPFGLILLDENVAAHLALGFGFPELADEQTRELVNQSGDHLDLSVGSDNVTITAYNQTGERRMLIHDGRWASSSGSDTRF